MKNTNRDTIIKDIIANLDNAPYRLLRIMWAALGCNKKEDEKTSEQV